MKTNWVLGLAAFFVTTNTFAAIGVATKDMGRYCELVFPAAQTERQLILDAARAKFLESFGDLYKTVYPGQTLSRFTQINEDVFKDMRKQVAEKVEKLREKTVTPLRAQFAAIQASRKASGQPPLEEKCVYNHGYQGIELWQKICLAEAEVSFAALDRVSFYEAEYASLKDTAYVANVVDACNKLCHSLPAKYAYAGVEVPSVDIVTKIFSGTHGTWIQDTHQYTDIEAVKKIEQEGNANYEICRKKTGQNYLNDEIWHKALTTRLTGLTCYDDNDPKKTDCVGSPREYKEKLKNRVADEGNRTRRLPSSITPYDDNHL